MSLVTPVRRRQPVVVAATLVCAASMLVALTGFAVASGLHTVSHAIDDRLGGHASDVPSLGLLTLVAVVAIADHLRGRKS